MITVNTSKLATAMTDNQKAVANTVVSSIATALNDAELIERFSRTTKTNIRVDIPLSEMLSYELYHSLDYRTKYEVERQLSEKIQNASNVVFNYKIGEKFESAAQYEADCLDCLTFTLDLNTLG
ncbi:hypothetical protein Xoosp14_244 [Xanthomonas phage Xoo-sp14]|nr:hypothetical protein Xoosp14_244 [Xanthomonas phage Xoo-sp14]